MLALVFYIYFMEGKFMKNFKKFIKIATAILLVFTLASCGHGGKKGTDSLVGDPDLKIKSLTIFTQDAIAKNYKIEVENDVTELKATNVSATFTYGEKTETITVTVTNGKLNIVGDNTVTLSVSPIAGKHKDWNQAVTVKRKEKAEDPDLKIKSLTIFTQDAIAKNYKIEVENDVDSYSIVVSKKAECNFIINSDCDTKAYITDKDGIKLSETYIYKGKANNSLSAFGNGEKVFVRIQSENYTGKYTIKPCIASVNLKLTKYKRGTAVIKGKTRGYADVRVYYNEKYYDVTSNANGNFAINLDTKLKAKSKIEITVSKSGQDSIVKTFKVK